MADEFLDSRSSGDEGQRNDEAERGDRERLQILIIGSREGVIETIHNLHRRGFAEVNDWSTLLPTPISGEMMSILRRDRVIGRSD
ncbi:MAG: hypothetical protein HC881_13435 [Leptolyngbyaceae cyanobacterium SL_7_1]|nr:hypothetical protein [Leptolyngbyaceae cyanobacterium SL_7_1]